VTDDLDSAPTDTISGAIESAIAEHEAAAPPAAAPPHSAEADEPHHEASSSDRDEPDRDEPERDSRRERGDTQSSDREPAKPSAREPASWADRNPEVFGRLPVEGQRYVRELERERKDNASLREHYEPVRKMFEPHADKIKAAGMTPSKLIEGWSKAETRLLDPRDKANLVAEVIHTYGVDLREVAHALQEVPTRLASVQQDQRQTAERHVSAEINTFSAAKGRDGRPLYPLFKELENSMAALAGTGIGAGLPHAERLTKLYEAAVWANPKHRQAAIATRARAKQPNAGRRLNGHGGGSIRDELEMAMGAKHG
jgi:hypothetical protein